MNTLEQIIGQEIPHNGFLDSAKALETSEVRASNPPNPFEESASITKAQQIAKNMAVYFDNPWAMIEDGAIWTHDEVDLLHPIKKFPNEPWLQLVTSHWLSERLFAMYKSRRMKITWLMVFLHTWLAMFNEGAAVYFVSDKEEKSDELVRRAAFIIDHIPEDMVLKPAYKYSYCYLDFPGLGSFIHGVPQGADQLRQYGATAIYDDEIAFWDRGRETFMASKPTIDGGGRVTLTSSPKDGFFKELCFDLIR